MRSNTNSLEETEELAGKIAKLLKEKHIAYLIGDLGSGKTTLSKFIAQKLGFTNFKLKSPTYNYIRKYEQDGKKLYHIDLYRIEELDQLLKMEIDEICEEQNAFVLIEWADRIKEKHQSSTTINLSYIDETTRKIEIS
ncbi:tRNA (adenosine(37)-N6)-threonylcarbamoyltransferase complex ATPase subunit type 1 TsaE [Patescibacteria group bacterium]|nr:tRNA (adenosine(37)-N6)-threonylcarbamoyltransferase complex ATPase subunit type 1 TsaE [Patescibacteria group bacterium]